MSHKQHDDEHDNRFIVQEVFLVGLDRVLNWYTHGCLKFSDARAEVEKIQNDEEQDWYEDIPLFGVLTPKEKIVALAKVADEFRRTTDDLPGLERWKEATRYVVFQGLKEALEMETDRVKDHKGQTKGCVYATARTIFAKAYNEIIAEPFDEPAAKPEDVEGWKERFERFWDALLNEDPWAEEDFMSLPTYDDAYPPKSDEADFRRSLRFLLDITRNIRQEGDDKNDE